MTLLQSIPAVGPQVGGNLLSVMHSHNFGSAEQLAAYLGLVPVERPIREFRAGRAKLSKAGPARIRAVLYMAPLWQRAITRTSKPSMNVLLAEASPRCLPSCRNAQAGTFVLRCA